MLGSVLIPVAFAIALQQPAVPDAHVEATTGMRFVAVPAGTFRMGSPEDEPMRQADEVPHRVTLSRGFLIGKFEVTQREWRLVMNTTPSHFRECDTCPVENVNVHEVQDFLDRMTRRSGGSMRYRLPSEAEWEYACRAGTEAPFSTGFDLRANLANYDSRFPYGRAMPEPDARRGRTVEVGTFAPNAWGIHDMHGNVWEWTADWYGPYSGEPVVNPTGPDRGDTRVIRGGSWHFDANSARCALRYTHRPQDRGVSLGFRVVSEPTGQRPSSEPQPAPGVLTEGIACRRDPSQGYAVYLPSAYSRERRWPVVFVFDPRGRSAMAARLFVEAAERYGWIVVSSANTRSDGPWEPNQRAVNAMWPDVLERYAVDTRRIYTAGFSGTAVIGVLLSSDGREIAGVIAAGAPRHREVKFGQTRAPWFGAAGTRDFNFQDTRMIAREIEAASQPVRVDTFDGVHQWFPGTMAAEAIEWMELLAMRGGTRERDPTLIDAAWQRRLATAQSREPLSPREALNVYEEMVSTFEGLHDVTLARTRAAALASRDDVKRAARDEEKWDRFERRQVAAALTAINRLLEAESLPPPGVAIQELNIRGLKKAASGTGYGADAAGRVLSLIAAHAGFYLAREQEAAGNHAAAKLLRAIGKASVPNEE